MYILGDGLLEELEGPHLVLDELVIESPAQEFSVVVTLRRPLFAMKFEEYEPNGNIKEQRWKITNRAPKYYTYSYDALNRVTGAPYGFLYRSPSQGILAVQSNQYAAPSFGYDAVGNITAIKRMGMVAGVDCFEPKTIDNLDLDYEPMSHRLLKVKDTAPTDGRPHGFKPGANDNALYQHDDNGNMTYDPHKGLSMHYNFLNLPSQIGQMRLTYDATGRKWSKDGEFGVTSYVSGIEYLDGKLEAIYAPDGRMVAEYTNGQITRYRAEYFHQDHLGNTRLGFSDFNQNGRIDLEEEDPATPLNEFEVTQESHYYPFGMNHDGPWYATVAPENKYLYNGKELNSDYGIKLMDYGARWYDPAIGRWNVTDPLAEDYYPFSPYGYTLNNPVLLIDPDGMRVSIVGDKEYRNQVFNALINLALSSDAGAELVNNAFSSKRTLVIGNTMSEIENQLDEWNTEERGYATLAFDLDQATADLDVSNGRNGETLAQTVETSLA
ncbi:MAG: RHS repeat-associated core domain-containing protein [Lewinellaceae bacterium]|nr:RHS repeat-associated core domain-containing protein [Lewinellaceae bacterium]